MSYATSAHAFLRILQPSWYGGLFTVLFGIVTVAAFFIPLFYEGSGADRYFDSAKLQNTELYYDFNRLSVAVESSDFAGDVAVFVFWALVGLALYYILLSVVGVASNTIRFIQLVEYFKADRKRLEAEALVRLLLRLTAIFGLYLAYDLFISTALPYLIYVTHKALLVTPLLGFLYLLSACLIWILIVHGLVILVRLMLLKYRILRSSTDIISY